ncbi:unnamed protein product [Sphenostylis stenocarpa]|uniref:Uncharacterized protein n=1 Tax=Sphenostylis stenocarpa TaxID=92480 RepID=A0AA86SY63_9FABA|nr:unnamed protein product [Sphenostylis stenocarpa]
MACIHFEENTPVIMNILEMSNSTIESPVCLNVLRLIQLTGRLAPVLIDHQHKPKCTSLHSTHSRHIINAFQSYQRQNMGKVVVKLFTSISPYETMHDEICMLAADTRVCMLILPFHMQWRSRQISKSANPIKTLNRHLLETTPCSVGILIQRGNLIRNNTLNTLSFYNVGIIFVEGPDDREALTFAMRMADHPNVSVTLIRLLEPCNKSINSIDRDPDGDLVHKFKVDYIEIKRHDYREKIVADSVEMINVIRSFEGCYDLVLAGRRHDNESPMLSGLTEWHEHPELGSIGDMLVSPDSAFDGSVLVVHQQSRIGVGHDHFQLGSSIYSQINTMEV